MPVPRSNPRLTLALLITVGPTCCGGGSRHAPDPGTAASAPEPPRPPYCRQVGSSTSICGDEQSRASVDGATAQ